MKQIVFISSALQQPRHQKRIDLFLKEMEVDIYYFFRDKYTENYKNYLKRSHMIGKIEDGKYLSRFSTLIKLFFILKKSKIETVYCTSPDQAFISLLAGKKTFFEVGDLYQIDGRNKIYQILDNFIIPRISGLIITSPFFYSGYYTKFKEPLHNKVLVVENKLVPEVNDIIDIYRNNFCNMIDSKRIKLGLIGSLAFVSSLNLINEFMTDRENIELHIYGAGRVDIFKNTPNTFYHGKFKSPEDLSEIYSNIDINVILYDYDNNNVKLALPNKLYESIAFLKPIICAENVALSDYVLENKIGVVVKNNDLNTAINEIVKNYDFYLENLKKMPKKSYLCYEQEKILSLLN